MELVSASEVNRFHTQADTDTSSLAVHHTLGIKHNQAAHGDHRHDGINTRQLDGDSLAPESISEPLIAPGSITETKIQDDSISTPKLQAYSVIANKIASNAITTDKLSSNAVTTDKLDANAITAKHTIIGPHIATSYGYPRVEMSGINNDLRVYNSSGQLTLQAGSSVTATGTFKTGFSGTYAELTDVGVYFRGGSYTKSIYGGSDYLGAGSFVEVLSLQGPAGTRFKLGANNSAEITLTSSSSLIFSRDGSGWERITGKLGSTTPYLKWVSAALQVRNYLDNDWGALRVGDITWSSQSGPVSYLKNKKEVTALNVSPERIVKANGLYSWKWKDTDKPGIGLIADYMPEIIQTEEGYDLVGAVAILWEAVKDLYGRK